MKIAAIICEYNPLQNGHIYHISQTKKDIGADKTVCIMSGNFTQRGELAVANKYVRAIWAIKGGADIVVELPPQYVLTTARYFALGGIKIANRIKDGSVLSFGSEVGDLQILKDIAKFEESDEFKIMLDAYLKQGNGYAKSYALALEKLNPSYGDIIASPNNILAIEYLKALNTTQSDIVPYTLKRIGSGYRQTLQDNCPSASGVRAMWQNDNLQDIEKGVPPYVFNYLKDLNPKDFESAHEKIFSLLKYGIIKQNLKDIHGIKEGVENRIISTVKDSDNWRQLIEKLATKRYTNAYLLRTLSNILLSNAYSASELENNDIDYVNVLAVEKNSKTLLSSFDCNVITKSHELPNDSLILNADSLYSSVLKNMPSSMQIVER